MKAGLYTKDGKFYLVTSDRHIWANRFDGATEIATVHSYLLEEGDVQFVCSPEELFTAFSLYTNPPPPRFNPIAPGFVHASQAVWVLTMHKGAGHPHTYFPYSVSDTLLNKRMLYRTQKKRRKWGNIYWNA